MLHVPSMEGLGLAAFAVTPVEIAQRKVFVSIGSVCTTAGQAYEACDARVGQQRSLTATPEVEKNLLRTRQRLLESVRS